MPKPACRVSSCSELVCGDRVQAQIGDVVHFRGHVVALHEPMALFWAIDAIGERRIIGFDDYVVYLLTAGGEPHLSSGS